jgi:hypothetical protein
MHSSHQINLMELHHAILCMPTPMNTKTLVAYHPIISKSCSSYTSAEISKYKILVTLLDFKNNSNRGIATQHFIYHLSDLSMHALACYKLKL